MYAMWSGGTIFKGCEAVFEVGDALGDCGSDGGGCGCCGWSDWGFGDGATEEVHPADFAGARLALQKDDEWFFAGREAFEGGDDGGVVVEGVHALGAGAKFSGRLRAAEEKRAEDGNLVAAEVEYVADAVLELGDAGRGVGANEAEAFEIEERGADVGFGKPGDGLAVVFLVTGVESGVERERVVLGRGDLFFDERAEHAGFGGGEVQHRTSLAS
jgi:hypothetical protein